MLSRSDKEKIAKELTKEIEDAKSVIFTDYKGLDVNDLSRLRNKLREEEITYKVIKKTLIQIALKKHNIKSNIKEYKGPIALAISKKDEVAPAKIIKNQSKENDKLKMVGGVLNMKLLNEEEVENLAKLPSKEELIAKVVGSINSPLSGLVGVLSGVNRQFVQVLKAISEKKA